MYKKEADGSSSRSKRGQITIFIIAGLFILFVFFLLISLTSNVKKTQLENIQEKTLTKLFKKEALRIFVEDCLTDELEFGLIQIGKQGRLWNGQPGGTKNFVEGNTGVTYSGDGEENKIIYGIKREEYLVAENAYPCDNQTNNPEFCKYQYPNTKVGFGELQLKGISTIRNDLRRFLVNRAEWCVTNFTRSNISSQAQIETEQIDLKVSILDEGIDVKVDYPLKLKLGEEEFFHLSKFDFFYSTKFKDLLEAAVTFPLQWDWKYADFNLTEKTLEGSSFEYGNEISTRDCEQIDDYFLCKLSLRSDQYSSLSLEMKIEDLPAGDILFTFEAAPFTVLNNPGRYKYRFVRQDRAPALDYVSRLECPQAGYDYLVIKDDPEFGRLDISLSALDPDEDKIFYGFKGDLGTIEGQTLFTDKVEKGKYDVTAYSIDEHGVQDWQDIRVLVDRPAELGLAVGMPYKFSGEKELVPYEKLFAEDSYFISNEDPSFVKIIYPGESLADLSSTLVKFNYSNKEKSEGFEFALPSSPENIENCFSFPWLLSKNCGLAEYKDRIDSWKEEFEILKDNEFNYFKQPTNTGLLNVSFSTDYCGGFGNSNSAEAVVVVKECLPHVNEERPFAYPYHDYKLVDGEYVIDEEINPFLATHSCCEGVANNPAGWKLKDAGEECFTNPELGCYGQVLKGKDPYTAFGRDNPSDPRSPGLVLEKQQRLCSGDRGNVCDGNFKHELSTPGEKELLYCGSSDYPSCSSKIQKECENNLAFSIIENEGWCIGELGCTAICDKGVVYTGSEKLTFSSAEASSRIINAKATELKVDDDSEVNFPFKCGCSGVPDGKICDGNYDGVFDGKCSLGVCSGG